MNSKLLLLADEAVAQAALDAGIYRAFDLSRTPSTEITEYIQSSDKSTKRKHTPQLVRKRKNGHGSRHGNGVCRQACPGFV